VLQSLKRWAGIPSEPVAFEASISLSTPFSLIDISVISGCPGDDSGVGVKTEAE